jgi:phage tail sheath protein FI
MPTEFVTPGVYVQELDRRDIPAPSTTAIAFLGWTPAGAVGVPIAVASLAEFEAEFGGLDARGPFGHSVRHYFENGGARALVVRVADSESPEVPVLAGTDAFTRLLAGRGGLAALDDVEVDLLCAPGETRTAVLAAMQAYCLRRRAFLIADAPREATLGSLAGGAPSTLTGPAGANTALYWPWVLATNPLTGATQGYPPSGFVAGVYARTDAQRGVWKAPAGREASVLGVAGLAETITDVQQDPLNAHAINVVRHFQGTHVVWGARTLAGQDVAASEWKYVPVRRLALLVEKSLDRGLDWTVFEPNDEPLWARVRSSVSAFLHALFQQGAFLGRTPREAYFVRCDASAMSAAEIEAGLLVCIVGFAAVKPAEFVALRIEKRR